jgi:hypothetical protein
MLNRALASTPWTLASHPLPTNAVADLSFVFFLPNRRLMTRRHQQTTKLSIHPLGLR